MARDLAQLTHRDGGDVQRGPPEARANADKITGYWIEFNFVLTGPAVKVHVGFERTFSRL